MGLALPPAALVQGRRGLDAETERARDAQVCGVPTLMLDEWPIGGIQDERTTLHLLDRYVRKKEREEQRGPSDAGGGD